MTALAAALAGIHSIVGTRGIKRAPAELETYASDGLPTLHSRPAAIVLPDTAEAVAQIVRILAQAGIPFVARGAGTGLSGGAVADPDAVIIALTRLNRILDIDPVNRRAIIQPGVVNARLSDATRAYGLHYAPDPSSQAACTIGGNVAENAGGPHCLKYGVTSNHVMELDVVLPTGETVTLGSPGGDAWGPDLAGLFVGSEGMFGIATRITVRLVPLPRAIVTLLADFMSIRAAGRAVSEVIASGLVPAALEMMDQSCVKVVEESVYAAGYPCDAAAVLLVELDGSSDAAVAAEAAMVTDLLQSHGARSVRTATSVPDRMRLWQGRKKAFGALGRISPDLVVQDAVVPRSALPDVLDQISQIGTRYGVRVSNVFHAGDGNLHPNISFDGSSAEERERVDEAASAIMEACIAAGGSITGEHGVGRDKLRYMPLLFDADTLTAMRDVRRVFDPHERSNPGKVIPMHSCREWWAAGSVRAREAVA